MELVEESELYPPLAPTAPLHGGTTWQPWGWARCQSCGAVQGKPLTRDGRKVLSGAGRCVLCGHKH